MLSARRFVRRHLSERELLAVWHDGQRPEHLHDCEVCRGRYAALLAFVDRQRNDALDAADEAFPAARLAAQQGHVMRRLESLTQPVRVLTFPAPRRARPMVSGAGRRWVAMAAAAGLLIGLAAGLTVNVHPFGSGFAPRTTIVGTDAEHRVARGTAAATASLRPADRFENDEVFLSELESALGSPHVAELQAIDALTPSVLDVAVLVR